MSDPDEEENDRTVLPVFDLAPYDDLDDFARAKFGPAAAVPRSSFHHQDEPVVGYIATKDGCYAVVEVQSQKDGEG